MTMLRCAMMVALITLSSSAAAQGTPTPPQRSSSIQEARFEIVQSPQSPTFIFRVDRFTGRVWQLTSLRGGLWEWEETPVPESIAVSTPNRPRFQLHVTGGSYSQTLLIDTETGKSWQFTNQNPSYQREQTRNGHGWEVLRDR
jgi:hypothetical protein